MTRRVLLVAYHFPPIGGAAAQRAVQLVRHLPPLGYDPVVVTGPGTSANRWAPLDAGLATELEELVEVRRLASPEPRRDGRWAGRLERWFRIPPAWARWWAAGVEAEIQEVRGIELVHAIVAPYETAGTARRLAQALEIPVVMDLEDPWALDEMWIYPTRLHRRLGLRRMGVTLAAASAVVMNSGEAARRARTSFGALASRIVAVPNAYDERDFERPAPRADDSVFRLVHTGSLHTDLGLRHQRASRLRRFRGGSVRGVDFLPRSHVFLLKALDVVVERRPDIASALQLEFAGVLTDVDVALANKAAVRVKLHGFLPHAQTIDLIRSADLLFLPLHDVAPGSRVAIVPQKTYEYLASGRPILAAVPPGDARDAIAVDGNAALCAPRDADAMARAIIAEFDRWRAGDHGAAASDDIAKRYGAKRLAADVADVYDRLLTDRAVRPAD